MFEKNEPESKQMKREDSDKKELAQARNLKPRQYLKVLLSLVVLFIMACCNSKHSKAKLIGSSLVSSNLWTEAYLISAGGVWASNTYSYYLTDSVYFRKYIGTVHFDDEQLFCGHVDADHVMVYISKRYDNSDTSYSSLHSLSYLKAKGDFD